MDGWYYSVKIKKNEVENVEKVGILEFEEFEDVKVALHL